jgi:hypothetical protein
MTSQAIHNTLQAVIALTLIGLLGMTGYAVHLYTNNGLFVRVFYGSGQAILPEAQPSPTPAPTPAQKVPRVKHG